MFYASFILMETVRPFLEARSPGLGQGRVGGRRSCRVSSAWSVSPLRGKCREGRHCLSGHGWVATARSVLCSHTCRSGPGPAVGLRKAGGEGAATVQQVSAAPSCTGGVGETGDRVRAPPSQSRQPERWQGVSLAQGEAGASQIVTLES